MFERPHHRRIAAVLAALDGPLLCANGCLFGGGTAIALRYGEYRESVDIDFLVSHAGGYRELRQRLTGPGGIGAIVRDMPAWTSEREIRADQYGIRTALEVDGHEIKFEIVREARIELAPPGPLDLLCGVATLTPLDMVTSKLLANSDRWADDGAFSRDLIDLAMMAPALDVLRAAVAKAEPAYGDSVHADLGKAVERLKARHGRLERCMQALQVRIPPAALWQKILALRRRTERLAS
jgi:Nucleotidyl transferase AbiEii toxin, Type IV TA system